MLKIGTKRRRTTAQIEAERDEAILEETVLQERLANAARLEAESVSNQNAADILRDFIAKGVAV